MKLPDRLLKSMQGLQGFDETSFIDAHRQSPAVSIRINPKRNTIPAFDGIELTPVPWCATGYYLSARPSFTFDPLFHAGVYYVQEASSMFLEQAFTQLALTKEPLKVLDLSAAPGGKSTHLQSLISSESLLVSNEVIRGRASVLRQNIIKWGAGNVVVTSNDPQHFQRLEGYFDVVVVDAPCSGSGLFRKDDGAISEWSEDNVALCQGRQKRILADVLPALKEDGILIYSTCSYSTDENEEVTDWLLGESSMQSVALEVPGNWGIVTTNSPAGGTGYRFYPDKVKGEGFYLACFRKKAAVASKKQRVQSVEKLTAKEASVAERWLRAPDHALIKHGTSVIALPHALLQGLAELRSHLFIQYAGTMVGELIRDKLVPDHSLALSPLISPSVPSTELTKEEAIRYLQKAELSISPAEKGWQLVQFKGNHLGWVNVLSGRINNYYPKEMRILTQRKEDEIH